MGYYAHMEGTITPKTKDDAEKIAKFINDMDYYGLEYYDRNQYGLNEILVWNNEKYYEEDYDELVDGIWDYVDDFIFEFSGEDGALWGFFYNKDLPHGYEDREGRVVYDCGPMQAFIGQIIDGFEDFLDRRGIVLDNPERDENVVAEEAVNIYGTDYGELQSYIEDTLNNWGLNWQ